MQWPNLQMSANGRNEMAWVTQRTFALKKKKEECKDLFKEGKKSKVNRRRGKR